MALMALSDRQTVDTEKIEKVELGDDELWILFKDETGLTVKGPGIGDDADLLDQIRDREKLHYLVFRKPKSK